MTESDATRVLTLAIRGLFGLGAARPDRSCRPPSAPSVVEEHLNTFGPEGKRRTGTR
jgi:hypothetical protein